MQLQYLQNALARASRIHSRIKLLETNFALVRLLGTLLCIAILASVFSYFSTSSKIVIVFLFLLISVLLSVVHNKFKDNCLKWTAIKTSYELSIARFERNFSTIMKHVSPWFEQNKQSIPFDHIFASDLDIGTGVFPLLDTCVTEPASYKLAQLLIQTQILPEADTTRNSRLAHAQNLAKKVKFLREHEALRINSAYVEDILRDRLLSKNEASNPIFSYLTNNRNISFIAISVISIILWAIILIPSYINFFTLLFEANTNASVNSEMLMHNLFMYAIVPIISAFLFRNLVSMSQRLSREARPFELVLKVFGKIKTSPEFSSFSFLADDASKSFTHLRFLLDLLTVRNNPILWLFIHAILPFDALVCLGLVLVTKKIIPKFNKWSADLTDFDLACAIARFSYENPHCNFFAASNITNDLLLDAQNLGHPLLPVDKVVLNSISFTANSPLVLLTGSNMSGKSTFLRALGVNMVLYNIGAPVCATKFTTPLRIPLCAIRVDDSLEGGTSYFYAEVKRLKKILDLLAKAEPNSTFVLIDEIFRGTNNRERFIGSSHILNNLLASGTDGMVTTHDLSLTELSATNSKLRNCHFREHIIEQKLAFDYTLREGPCPTTNALFIMNMAGLPVPL